MPSPTPFDRRLLRGAFIAMLALVTTACQTTQVEHSPYTREQIEVLRGYEFVDIGDNWELGLQGKLLFEFDDSNLVAEQRQRIDDMARGLLRVGLSGARVEGHTDQVGTAQYNQQLSLRRAEAVKQAMVSGGMRDERVTALGKGPSQPIADNATEEGRRENRRVVIIIAPENAVPY